MIPLLNWPLIITNQDAIPKLHAFSKYEYVKNEDPFVFQEIDEIRQSIGVDRAALIKIWLHERVQQEKTGIPRQ